MITSNKSTLGVLPLIGDKCEARLRGGSLGWMKATFKGGYDNKVWFRTIGCEYTVFTHDVEFRPLENFTDEEVAIDDLLEPLRFCSAKENAKSIIEAIKAGKIHGVKWVGK